MLYNKYRPTSFDGVCAQEHVKQVLAAQVQSPDLNKLAQAYLFTGPAGVGKTTVARIFASMVNCSTGPTINPPANDPFVEEILSGRGISDVVEMDAASNGNIDAIRELRKNAYFACAQMRRKFYIIDECHELSNEAWEALLKIIEEPPEHVIFILCTTKPTAVTETVESRCMCFAFRSLSIGDISSFLKKIALAEGLNIDESGLRLISTMAKGSLRRAMSHLEQFSCSNQAITSDAVAKQLGVASRESARDFILAAIRGRYLDSLKASSEALSVGVRPEDYLSIVACLCRDMILYGAKGYDMEAAGFSTGEIEDTKMLNNELLAISGQHRIILDKWIMSLNERANLSIFNQQPQYQVDVAFIKMVYELKEHKEHNPPQK